LPLVKVVSGGQTGVDRAALEAAIQLGLSHGGSCPLGRRAEDGRVPDRYLLSETDSPAYRVRTERNVADSDGTLILCRGPVQGGTRLTRQLARRHHKPCRVVDLGRQPDLAAIRAWRRRHAIAVLNVAGPRESQAPGIGAEALDFCLRLFVDA
jgi:hypothetical protein